MSATDHILDVGSGIGGPARYLADRFGCRVTGIDLTTEFCEVARHVTRALLPRRWSSSSASSGASISRLPGLRCRRYELQRSSTAIFFALLEVPFDVSHLIRNVGKADDWPGAGAGGKASIAHVKHVTEGWKDTPGKMGLGPTMEEEAMIAEKHAGFAASKPSDLKWVKTHIRHVRHAIDASTESSGPGKGYGGVKASGGVAKHINFAAGSGDSSSNIKLHAKHVSTSAKNVVRWSNRILLLSENILSAKASKKKDMKGVRKWVKAIHDATKQILNGFDANGDGKTSWTYGEGGVAQAKQHMGFIKKGEGM